MAWIEFHVSKLRRLKKFLDFRKDLGWNTCEALGFLGCFWGEVIELSPDGDITGWTPEYLCELIGISLEPKRVWDSLVKHGWIDFSSDGRVTVHDWSEVTLHYVLSLEQAERRKELTRERVRAYRERQKVCNAPVTLCNAPNLTKPNQTKPEKHCRVAHDLDAPVVYLNQKANRSFDPKHKSNRELIRARYVEGRTLDDFKRVVDRKVRDWGADEKMSKYLRPSTLFNRTNFENYLNEPERAGESPELAKLRELMEAENAGKSKM